MKNRIILISLLSMANLEASNVIFSMDQNNSKKEIKVEVENKFTKDNARKALSTFQYVTGESDKRFNELLAKSWKDKDWIIANEFYYYKKKEAKIRGKKINIPMYKQSLVYFLRSAERGNILSAYQGLNIIVRHFTFFKPRMRHAKSIVKDIIQKYMGKFSQILIDKNYCYGYLNGVKFNAFYNNDLLKSLSIGEIGLKTCKEQFKKKMIPHWLDSQFRMSYVKVKAIYREKEKLKKKKEEIKKYGGILHEK